MDVYEIYKRIELLKLQHKFYTQFIIPIGSLFLNDNQSGFYIEKFPLKLPKHSNNKPNITIITDLPT